MTQVVICGAGIAGVSTAFHLTRIGFTDVTIIDPLPPLTLTSDKSTECYRNWWPNEPMVRLMNRSIELLDRYADESGNIFGLNRRGYLYLTGTQDGLERIAATADLAMNAGAGELRVHGSTRSHPRYPPAIDYRGAPDGADLFLDGDELRRHFPYVSDGVVGGLHARVAGWLSAQQLGAWLLDEALECGATYVRGRVTDVGVHKGRVESVTLEDGSRIDTTSFVNAAGPMLGEVGQMTGVDLPVFSELHAKTAFRDHLGAVPRHAPMIIWSDPQQIRWTPDELGYLRDQGRAELLDHLPAGCHARPEGGPDSPWVLGLWEYDSRVMDPVWPLPFDAMYTEIVLRGLSTAVPDLAGYQDRLPEATVDGGYYTKTIENRPLAGPVGPTGSFVCGALSGFGIMAACGVGELVATAISAAKMPDWAHWFDLGRYESSEYLSQLATARDTGQL